MDHSSQRHPGPYLISPSLHVLAQCIVLSLISTTTAVGYGRHFSLVHVFMPVVLLLLLRLQNSWQLIHLSNDHRGCYVPSQFISLLEKLYSNLMVLC